MCTSTDSRARWLSGSISSGSVAALTALILAFVVAPDAFGQVPPSSIERLVPADAFLALSIDDAAAAANQFGATPLGTMLGSPAWKPYFASLDNAQSGSVMHLCPWFGIDWGDLAQHSVPICICRFADPKNQPALALVVDVHGQAAAAKALPERAAAYFQGRKAKIAEEKGAEGKRVIYSLAAGAAAPRETVCLVRQDLVALVTSRGGADRLEAFWQAKKGPALSDAAEYQQVQKQAGDLLAAPSDVRWWIRPLELVRTLPPPPASAKRGRRDWRITVEKLGIGGVQGVGGTIRLARSESASIEVSLAVLAKRPFDKALQLASLEPGPWRDPPALAGADTASWSLLYRDIKSAFEGFGTVYDVKAGPENEGIFRDYIDRLKEEPDGPHVNIRRELLPRLKPTMVRLSDFGGDRPEWNKSGRRDLDLIVIDAKEMADLEKVFRRWFTEDVKGKRVRLEIVQGLPLWAAAPGHNLFLDAKENPERTLTSLAISHEALLLSTDEAWLQSVLENKTPDATLTKDARFAAAVKYLKGFEAKGTSLRSFVRMAPIWNESYEDLKSGEAAEENDMGRALLELLLFGATAGTPKDLTGKLPDWRDVAPALGTCVASTRVTPAGFAGIVSQLADGPPQAAAKGP